MCKLLGILVALIFTSLYFFPVSLIAYPDMNSKTAMAIIGGILLVFNLSRRRAPYIDSGLLRIALWALAVSFISILSMVYNDTNDDSYATYIISMCVWLSASYVVSIIIYQVHGDISVKLIANYLIAVCTLQCILAFIISQSFVLEELVNSIFLTGGQSMSKGRLYGIGASVDIAGLRFMAVLVIISYVIFHLTESESKKYLKWYVLSFFIIGFIGNMISRTSMFGVIIGILYLGWGTVTLIKDWKYAVRLWQYIYCGIFLIIVGATFLYNTNKSFHDSMHFGFEGFFSLYDDGEWNVNSNRSLIYMLKNIRPEHTRTWVIGDGYCGNPSNDPYYIGIQYVGYYMDTDVGYMRFIFYFGVIGTLIFMGYFYQVAYICGKHYPRYSGMFFLILLCNFIGWVKVSTDLFLVFAIFLSMIFINTKPKIENVSINGLSQVKQHLM